MAVHALHTACPLHETRLSEYLDMICQAMYRNRLIFDIN